MNAKHLRMKMNGLRRLLLRFLLLSVCLGCNTAHAVDFTLIANPDPVVPGAQVSVQMIVTNNSAAIETNLSVQMTYPTGFANISEVAVIGPFVPGSSCNGAGSITLCQPGELLNWDIGTLTPGQSSILRIIPAVAAGLTNGDMISVAATLSDESSTLASVAKDLEVNTSPALSLFVEEDKNPVATGDALTYTLRYGNRSNGNVSVTNLEFELPAGATFVSATGGGSFADGVVSWPLGTFAVGAVAQQQVVVSVDNGLSAGTQLVAAASISGTSNFNPTETRASSNSVIGFSPLDISLQVNPVSATGSEQVDVQMVVTNTTAANVSGAWVRMIFPQGVNNVSEASVIGPFDPATSCDSAGSTTLCQPSEPMYWNLGTVAPGQSVIMNVPTSAISSSPNGAVIPFAAVVTDDNGHTAVSRDTLIVDTAPELTLSVTENKNPVQAGDTLTYTLRYGNRSSANVTGTSLNFELPVGATFVSATGNGNFSNGVVSWNVGTFAVGAVTQQQVVVAVDAGLTAGRQLESAAAIAGISDFNQTERRATGNTMVGSAPLDITVQVNPVSATGNERADVELVVTNTSTNVVTGAAVRMVYPQGANNVAEADIQGPFDAATSCASEGSITLCQPSEALNWNLGTVAPGQSVIMSIPASPVSGSVNGRVIPFAAVATDDAGNNVVSRDTLIVDTAPEFTLSLVEDKNPVVPGETLTYTLRYGNRSSGNVTASALSFELPVGTSFVSATGGGIFNDGVVTWNLGTFALGVIGQQQVEVAVDSGLVNGQQLESAAAITGTSAFSPTERRATSNTSVGASPFDISMQINPGSAASGEQFDLQMVLTNTSLDPVTGVSVSMVFPQGANNVDEAIILGPFEAATSCASGGSITICQAGETLNWNPGTLAPGQTVLMTVPTSVSASFNGRMLPFTAVVTDDLGHSASAAQSLVVNTAPALTLSLTEDETALAGGDTMLYRLRYGNQTNANVSAVEMTFTIPENVTLDAVSPGAIFSGNKVSWSLGTLAGGATGERQVRVQVAAGIEDGVQIEADADIAGVVNFAPTVRYSQSVAIVDSLPELDVELTLVSIPSDSGDIVDVQMSVTNNTASTISGTTLKMIYPTRVNNTNETDITGPFDAATSCVAQGSGTICQAYERLNWNVGFLAPGQQVVASLPPVVANGVADGSQIRWKVVASADSGLTAWQVVELPIGPESAFELVPVEDLGCSSDADGDGVCDNTDNCSAVANANQRDTDDDGFGNVCDADLNNDGIVNTIDLGLFRQAFGQSGANLNADFDGNGNVNTIDLGIFRQLFGKAPGPSGVAP